jgi:hypothetical protein
MAQRVLVPSSSAWMLCHLTHNKNQKMVANFKDYLQSGQLQIKIHCSGAKVTVPPVTELFEVEATFNTDVKYRKNRGLRDTGD